MRRGFKTEAERQATRLRTQLGTTAKSPVDVRQLAQSMSVELFPADRLIDQARLEELESLQVGAFSAATFNLPNDRVVIVYNPLNDSKRTLSDIAHELAHILLSHEVRELQNLGGQTFFTCDPEQEAEANWLAGCLLLPRDLLLQEAYKDATPQSISLQYGVSEQMAKYRLNASGVTLQVSRARKKRTG